MKKVIAISAILVAIFIGYAYLYFNPIFIGKKNVELLNDCRWSNSMCNPIDSIDFTRGNNKIIIYVDREDMQFLPAGIKQRMLFSCTDNTTIQQIEEHFEFEWNDKDYTETTAGSSKIYFFKDNKLIFQSLFIFEQSISIYFKETGWVFSTKYDILKDNFAKFKPMYNPIVILR
jgi:hypothetical protein